MLCLNVQKRLYRIKYDQMYINFHTFTSVICLILYITAAPLVSLNPAFLKGQVCSDWSAGPVTRSVEARLKIKDLFDIILVLFPFSHFSASIS